MALYLTLVVTLVSMTLLWLHSLRIKDSSIVDIFWGLRLSIHIFRRNQGKPEDFRSGFDDLPPQACLRRRHA
ncbi:MAG TPA: DUF1295 domain-containing protein [Anaerolineales bacterium]|nr:DUF1295 domain-containing protein [Anaerolineales bacterium]